MKNLVVSFVALISFAVSAEATFLPGMKDVRLKLTIVPLAEIIDGVGQKPGLTTTVSIRRNGMVTTQVCKSGIQAPCKIKKVEYLTAYEMDQIERNIEDARAGEIVNFNGAHCMAVNTELATYSADNGKMLLLTGERPCGNPTYNDTDAARELVSVLNRLHTQAIHSEDPESNF